MYAHDLQWARMSAVHQESVREARGVLGEGADEHDVQNFARELRGQDPIPRPPPPDPNAPTFQEQLDAALREIQRM